MLFMRFPSDLGKVIFFDIFGFLTSKLVKMCYGRDLDVPSASQNVREFGQDLQELEGVYNFFRFFLGWGPMSPTAECIRPGDPTGSGGGSPRGKR